MVAFGVNVVVFAVPQVRTCLIGSSTIETGESVGALTVKAVMIRHHVKAHVRINAKGGVSLSTSTVVLTVKSTQDACQLTGVGCAGAGAFLSMEGAGDGAVKVVLLLLLLLLLLSSCACTAGKRCAQNRLLSVTTRSNVRPMLLVCKGEERTASFLLLFMLHFDKQGE